MTSPDPCKRYRDSDLVFYEELRLEKREAFSCLYLQTYRQCIPYVLQRGSDQEQAEDLLQDCLAIFVTKVRDGSYVHQKGSRITTYFQSIYINQWKKWIEIPETFECAAPFGFEMLLAYATEGKFKPIEKIQNQNGFTFILDDLKNVVDITSQNNGLQKIAKCAIPITTQAKRKSF